MRLRPGLAVCLLWATAAMAAPARTHAPPKASAQAPALARAVRDHRAEASGVEDQIGHLRAQLVALGAVEASGERGVGGKQARLAKLNAQEEALAERLGRERNATARL